MPKRFHLVEDITKEPGQPMVFEILCDLQIDPERSGPQNAQHHRNEHPPFPRRAHRHLIRQTVRQRLIQRRIGFGHAHRRANQTGIEFEKDPFSAAKGNKQPDFPKYGFSDDSGLIFRQKFA